METTFITIHDLSPQSLIAYSSDSIVDVLGYTPDEVVGQSTWLFFKTTELPNARQLHDRSVRMDKASVLVYCDLRNRNNEWVRCECCFSIVYNVLVACTSVYRESVPRIQRRANAPIVRRLFSSSPNDPRYHMLQHLSARFDQNSAAQTNEPRAALFLNRFTRTLTIMYATSAIEHILGITGEQMKGRSFYHCIAETCLSDAVNCLESAKANDSIAYLRFLFRNPLQDDESLEYSSSNDASDAEMTDAGASELGDESPFGNSTQPVHGITANHPETSTRDIRANHDSINGFGLSTNGSAQTSHQNSPDSTMVAPIELEAVISCTSDGLVVCLRRSRPALPQSIQNTLLPTQAAKHGHGYTGYYAAPWAPQPVYQPHAPTGFAPTSYPGMPSMYGGPPPISHIPDGQFNTGAMDDRDFLRAIQECGVFAWDLVGINGSLADIARGEPQGESFPPGGPEVWSPLKSGDASSGRGTGSGSSGDDSSL